METDDVFMFCQNELPYSSFIAFEEMRKNGQFCDLTIKVQNHSFTAHRMILAAGIPYFNSVFTKNAVDVDGEKEFTVPDLDPGALESLIHFAYTGKVVITIENVNPLLVTSQFLQLNQVLDSCVEFLSKRLSVDTVFKVHTFASGLINSKLIENCNLYIRNNFEEFSKCVDFLSLPYSCFKEIIAEDDLMVTSEEVVFDAVMKWIKAFPSERHVVLPEMLSEVRLIYLSLDYFIERVDFEELILSSVVCRNLVKEAKTYLMLPEKGSEFSNLKMRPRSQFRHELFAFCSCKTCGYSVHHLVNGRWRQWPPSEQDLCDNEIICVVGVNDKMYIFLNGTIETFCITSYKWEKLTTTHNSSNKGSAVVPYEDKIYCFGSEYTNFQTKFCCFDTTLNQWLKEVEMKTKRRDSAGASLKEWIYITGGYSNSNRINTVEKYSPSTGQWSDVASMLAKRDEHGCTALNEEIYVCGGRTDGSILNTAEVYDPITNQWNYISSMAKAHFAFTLISDNNRIYALHDGYDMEVYDPKRNEWKCCLKVPGGFLGAVMLRCSYIKSIPA